MSASSDTTIGRHRISTKTVPAVGILSERSALCTHVGMCRGGRFSGFCDFSTLLLSGHFGGTRQQWGRQHGGRGFGAADMQVGSQDRAAPQSRDIVALHTALLEGGGQECAGAE